MFCQLSYAVDKVLLRKYFIQNFKRSRHHKTAKSEILFWRKLFEFDHLSDPIIKDLGLSSFEVSPRFSFQPPNTALPVHIDIDRIVGINFNLMPEPATIHMRGIPHSYEACLIDVGTVPHSVEPIHTARLVLKLAIRAPWHDVREAVAPYLVNRLDAVSYKSLLSADEEHLVKL